MTFSLDEQNFIIALVFFSVFGFIGVYNLFLYFSTREIIYRDYSIFVMGMSGYTAVYVLSPFYQVFSNNLSVISAALATLGSLLFVKTFLGIDKVNHSKIFKIFSVATGLSIGVIVLHACSWVAGSTNNLLIPSAAALVAFSSLLLELFTGIFLYNKEPKAKLFLWTSSPLFCGVFLYILIWFALQVDFDPGEQALALVRIIFYGSVTLQMILFSIVIGYRVNKLKLEQLIAQKEMTDRLTKEVEVKTAEINKSRDELKSTNDLKNKLFTLVSHDLRDPLTSLLGMVAMLERKAISPEELNKFLNNTKEKIHYSVHTLNRILKWSHSQLDGMTVIKRRVPLTEVVSKSVTVHSRQLQEKSIELEVNIDKEHHVKADGDMIETVIRNLLSNSIKFSLKSGKIELSSLQKEDRILLVVKDHGVGMEEEWLNKLIKDDENMTSSGTAGETGLGFGLLISRDFIRLNDGRLYCDSKIGEGTSFTLELEQAV